MPTELSNAEQIAKRFGVSVNTVRKWVRDGRIPFIRASRRIVRFKLDDVEAALSTGAKAVGQ